MYKMNDDGLFKPFEAKPCWSKVYPLFRFFSSVTKEFNQSEACSHILCWEHFEHPSACPWALNTAACQERKHQLRTKPRAWIFPTDRAAHEHRVQAQLRMALKRLQGGSHQRSLANRPRRAYLLKPLERQVCGFWEVTKSTWQNNIKSNFLTVVDTLLTIIGTSDPQVRHCLGPRHIDLPTDRVSTQLSIHVNCLQLTRTLSAHPQLSFNLCDFTCQHVVAWPIRNHNS